MITEPRRVTAQAGAHRYLATMMTNGEMVILSVGDMSNCWVFQGYAVWHHGDLSKAGQALADEVIEKLEKSMKTAGW